MSTIQDSDDYPFIRQVYSEECLKEEPEEVESPPLPLKKSITAGEAISKLNNILDVQARLQAFELPNDRPRRKFPRSEPISGSVRLAQLVSLERELKEAIYFRSLESPWTAFGSPPKTIKQEDMAKLAEEFHKQLAQEIPSNPLQLQFHNNAGNVSTYDTGKTSDYPAEFKSQSQKSTLRSRSKWPWAFQGKPGRKFWEPLPDTYIKPLEPWTKLREKSSRAFRKPAEKQQPPTTTTMSSSRMSQISKPTVKKSTKKSWDPATHKEKTEMRSKLVLATAMSAIPEFRSKAKAKSTRLQFQSTRTNKKLAASLESTNAKCCNVNVSTYSQNLPTMKVSGLNLRDIKAGKKKGYFQIPPLTVLTPPFNPNSQEAVDNISSPESELATIFSQRPNKVSQSKNKQSGQAKGSIPPNYPKPWQFFNYPNFGNLWDPTLFKPSGSAWESDSGIPVRRDRKSVAENVEGDSMELSSNRCSHILSTISSLLLSGASAEIKSQLESFYNSDSKIGRTVENYSYLSHDEIDSIIGPGLSPNTPPTATAPWSTLFPKVFGDMSQFQYPKKDTFYVDRGLEGALAEVQKAIRTALPTFKLDEMNPQLSESEIKSDEWVKKFIGQMTNTLPHKPRAIRLPLDTKPFVSSKSKPKEELKPRIPPKPFVEPKRIPNIGNHPVVFMVNGKPQIPDFTVGTHLNTYMYAPKTFDFPDPAIQRITRCTICRPYSFDSRPDPNPKPRKFCRNIPLPGFRDFEIFFRMDLRHKRLLVNGLRLAKGDECYRNVHHSLKLPKGMTLLDLEIYRSDKGTLFFHDSREELAIRKIELGLNEQPHEAHLHPHKYDDDLIMYKYYYRNQFGYY